MAGFIKNAAIIIGIAAFAIVWGGKNIIAEFRWEMSIIVVMLGLLAWIISICFDSVGLETLMRIAKQKSLNDIQIGSSLW